MRKLAFHILVLAILACPFICGELAHGQNPSQYTDSEKSLKQLIEALQDAAAKNDTERFRTLAEPLYFVEHEAWFKEIFGERLGGYASKKYPTQAKEFVDPLLEKLKDLARRGYDEPRVEKLEKPCSRNVLDADLPILFARRKQMPLYRVQFKGGGKSEGIGFFMFADGRYHHLGDLELELVADMKFPKPATIDTLKPAQLIHRKNPKYPEGVRIGGVVKLKAVIGRDGTVTDVLLETGPCVLVNAAIEAVRDWRYSPVMIGGAPIEAPTTITVSFSRR